MRCSAATSPWILRVNSRFLCRKSWKSWSPESSVSGAPCSTCHGAHSSTPSSSASPPVGTAAQHPPDTPGNPDPSSRMGSATRTTLGMVAAVWCGERIEILKRERDQCSLCPTGAGGSRRGLWVWVQQVLQGRVGLWALWVWCVQWGQVGATARVGGLGAVGAVGAVVAVGPAGPMGKVRLRGGLGAVGDGGAAVGAGYSRVRKHMVDARLGASSSVQCSPTLPSPARLRSLLPGFAHQSGHL